MGVDELNRVLKEEIVALLKENTVNDAASFELHENGVLCDHGGGSEWSGENDYDRKVGL